MQRWEYCAVVGVGRVNISRKPRPLFPAIWYFDVDGVQVVELKGQEAHETARAIALLGEQGWEMVAGGNLGDATHAIYFKRLRQDMDEDLLLDDMESEDAMGEGASSTSGLIDGW
jgi:hypothetical protein